jgi:scyllo-inositol 2-dehydrogenase (NADP+)
MTITRHAIRTAIVGLGWVGTNRHLPAVSGNSDFKLVGLVDARPGRAKDLADRFRVRHSIEADHLSGIAWLDEVDLIVIATEPARHASLVLEALAAGKHVLTEKPFAMNIADGEHMVAAARSAQRTLAIVHNFQFARSVVRLERDLAAGKLGAVQGLWGCQLGNPARRLPKWYAELPLGLFYDESPHLLYLLRRFGGRELAVSTVDIGPLHATTGTPATVYVRFTASAAGQQVPAVLSMFFEAPLSEWYFAVLGEHALGVVDIFRDIYVRLPNDGAHTASTILRTSLAGTAGHWFGTLTSGLRLFGRRLHYGNDLLYQRLAVAIREGQPATDIAASDALAVLKLQHAIMELRT